MMTNDQLGMCATETYVTYRYPCDPIRVDGVVVAEQGPQAVEELGS